MFGDNGLTDRFWGAHLGLLADNGGPTLTHALTKESLAIDAGSCTDSRGVTVMVDQRGKPRPQGHNCDIGAYESPFTSTYEVIKIGLPFVTFLPHPCTLIVPACNLTQIVGHEDSLPSWSPDGSKIVFVRSGTGILTMNDDGSEPHLVTTAESAEPPRWSPDGSKIAFVKLISPPLYSADIHVMDVDGTHQTNLTSFTDHLVEATNPVWSPDGSAINYVIAQNVALASGN